MSKRVSLFVTCIVDQLFPEIGMATVEVLERLGYTVDFPVDQVCCGQPAFNTGYRREAAKVACRCLEVLRDEDVLHGADHRSEPDRGYRNDLDPQGAPPGRSARGHCKVLAKRANLSGSRLLFGADGPTIQHVQRYRYR